MVETAVSLLNGRFAMKRLLRWVFLSAGLFLFTTPLAAQGPATVSGRVVDSITTQPVPGVRVSVVGSALGALTDRDGRYTLASVPAGTVSLRAQRIGFAAQTRQIRSEEHTSELQSRRDLVCRLL